MRNDEVCRVKRLPGARLHISPVASMLASPANVLPWRFAVAFGQLALFHVPTVFDSQILHIHSQLAMCS